MKNEIIHGDCLEVMQEMPDNFVDAIVTDPPYGLSKEPDIAEVLTKWLSGEEYRHNHGGFMGKEWDSFVPHPDVWREAYRVLKPGGHILCFAGTRTVDLMMISLRLAGFEVRDTIHWVYGSGFPKNYNVSKGIDKRYGAEREVIDSYEVLNIKGDAYGTMNDKQNGSYKSTNYNITAPATDLAKQWEGWGTALKPAHEPIVMARKPLAEKTIAANVLKWGVGGLNIDGCRIPSNGNVAGTSSSHSTPQEGWDRPWRHNETASAKTYEAKKEGNKKAVELGRFPANLIHDGSDEVVQGFPQTTSGNLNAGHKRREISVNYTTGGGTVYRDYGGDAGSAARFFYCAKASKAERNMGLSDKEEVTVNDGRQKDIDNPFQRGTTPRKNNHPTVKPLALMRYLCRLITPPEGTVLDPFAGSGSTLIAAKQEGFNYIGIEMEEEYCKLIKKRMSNFQQTIF